jgi:hypothetical protein
LLKFNKERGTFYYKHTLKEDEQFHRMNFNRRGHQSKAELIPKYSGPEPIAANKKKVRFIEFNATRVPTFL